MERDFSWHWEVEPVLLWSGSGTGTVVMAVVVQKRNEGYDCDQIVLGFLFPFACFVCFYLFFCFLLCIWEEMEKWSERHQRRNGGIHDFAQIVVCFSVLDLLSSFFCFCFLLLLLYMRKGEKWTKSCSPNPRIYPMWLILLLFVVHQESILWEWYCCCCVFTKTTYLSNVMILLLLLCCSQAT